MSQKPNKSRPTPPPIEDDRKDWATIGLIVVSSSLLVWGPLLIG
jgi:hypothetical protein